MTFIHLQKSLSLKRSAKALASLSVALRQIAVPTVEPKIRQSLHDEALQLSIEAVELDPDDMEGWHALGNSYLMQFFSKQQADTELMVCFVFQTFFSPSLFLK